MVRRGWEELKKAWSLLVFVLKIQRNKYLDAFVAAFGAQTGNS